MTWPADDTLTPLPADAFGNFRPEEVLYDFEGPCIFTVRTPAHSLLLAYMAEDLEKAQLLRYLVSSTSASTVSELKQGLLSVRESLLRGSLWLVDVNYRYVPQQVFAVEVEQLPDDAFPAPSTMLLASLEPALRVKLEGPEVVSGSVPAPALSQVGEIAARALKSVFEWVARERRSDGTGRPPEWLRELYNLPMQRFAYGSLEISFGTPEPKQKTLESIDAGDEFSPDDITEEAWRLLREGLRWAATGTAEWESNTENDGKVAVLEALRRLAPNSTGPVTHVAVSGTKIAGTFKLDRHASKKIRSRLTKLKRDVHVHLQVFIGRVRDLDLDKLTLVLREVRGETFDLSLVLEDENLLEVAREAHYQELLVKAAVRSKDRKTWTVVDLEFAADKEG